MSEKWYENVTENGMLTKYDDGNDIFYIVLNKEIIVQSDEDRLSKLTPASVQEWWKLAPWQTMESAPKSGEIFLVKDKNGNVSSCYESEFGFEYDGITTDDETDFLGWLPLPKNGE